MASTTSAAALRLSEICDSTSSPIVVLITLEAFHARLS
jgi:hypothetical protein